MYPSYAFPIQTIRFCHTTHDKSANPEKCGTIDDHELFRETEDDVAFRTVRWFRAAVMFLKVTIAVTILSLPTTMDQLEAVGGSLCILGATRLLERAALFQPLMR